MSVYGIVGWPVAHSRSPAMQEAAFAACDLDARYVRFAVRPDALSDAIQGLVALAVAGANVTVPHKEAVVALLDDVDDAARAIGAVNTIVRRKQRLLGFNTDAGGLVRSLAAEGLDLDGARVVIVGAGGAARAAACGLRNAGAEVCVAARRLERASALVDELELHEAHQIAAEAFDGRDIVVQATSATMNPEVADAFAASLPWHALAPHAAVVDLVYVPRETTVLRAARERGHQCVDGTGMLVHQGALAFELWTGLEAPVEVMRRALEATFE